MVTDRILKILVRNSDLLIFAILECGQYGDKWPYIHTLMDEMMTEVKELKAKSFIPVHNSKFKLAQHPWYEPLEKVTSAAEAEGIPVATPRIGEKLNLNELNKNGINGGRRLCNQYLYI